MNKYRKLMSDTFILGIGTFASKALVLFLMPLYTSCLSPEQYNVADLISQTANLLIPLACAGVCDGLFRFTLDSSADKPSVLRVGMRILAVVSLIFLAASPLISLVNYFDGYVLMIITYVLSANLHSAFAQYVRAGDRMKLFAVQGIINTALVIGLNLLFLLVLDMGIYGYVLSVIISDLVVAVFLFFFARLYRDIAKGQPSRALTREMLRYSIPMIPTTIFWWVTNVSGRYFLTWLHGDAAAGLYAAAYKIPTMLTLMCTVFYEAWQSSAVKDAETKTKSGFFGSVFGYYSSLMFTAGAGIVLLCRFFVSILFADAYAEAWQSIPYITMAAIFSALTTFMGSVYLVKKKSWLSFATSMAGALTNLALNFLLIPHLGVQGAAISAAVSYAIVFVVRTVSVQKYVKFFVNYLRLSVNAILLAAMCAVSISGISLWWAWCGGIALLVLVINFATLWKCFAGAIRQMYRKKA